MQELNHLLSIDNKGISLFKDGEALNNNISEWLANAENTIADNPSWGHNLTPFWFCAQTINDAVQIEMSIIKKLPRDVKGVFIQGIRVSFPKIDSCQVVILHNFGLFSEQIALGLVV